MDVEVFKGVLGSVCDGLLTVDTGAHIKGP